MKCPHCGKEVELGLRKLKLGPDGKRKVPLTRKEIGKRFEERRKAMRANPNEYSSLYPGK